MKTEIDRGKLIHRFFEDTKRFLKKGGLIIMPYFHKAGKINDPEVQAPKHGLKVKVEFREKISSGLQKGFVSVYSIGL